MYKNMNMNMYIYLYVIMYVYMNVYVLMYVHVIVCVWRRCMLCVNVCKCINMYMNMLKYISFKYLSLYSHKWKKSL